MFTGIIQAVGHIVSIHSELGDYQLKIDTGKLPLDDAKIGESIAVDGVCLTAVELDDQCFTADVSRETRSRTMLGQAKAGSPVNLERALTPTTRLGGHFVSGHVDGLGEIVSRCEQGRSVRFVIGAPKELAKYIAEKGSICVNGISLTVNSVNGSDFEVNIVPHTLSVTNLRTTEKGDKVNLEVDLLARYLERLALGDKAAEPATGVTEELLISSGFLVDR